MPKTETMWYVNPLAGVDANDDIGKVLQSPAKKVLTKSEKSRRLSQWFVSNQKTEAWDEKQLNRLHIEIFLLLVIVYVCHVVASPYLQFINDQTAIIIIKILESLCVIVAIVCFIKMCYVN